MTSDTVTDLAEERPLIGRVLFEAYEQGVLHELTERLRRDGRFEEMVEMAEAARDLYDRNPDDVALGKLAGELTQRKIERDRHDAEMAIKPKSEAERRAADEQYEIDRQLGSLDTGAFVQFLESVHGPQCPGEEEREPHRLEGYVRRAGRRWECALCGYEEDVSELWRERHGNGGN